ncbi:MAG: hypothetical protein IKO41_21640 [Lachnospiraceae bacterium]|nr:hypothetical protein [Lachnospiraceae bacterium]
MPEDKSIYAHTTSMSSLMKMLGSGKIKSLRHIARETPDQELSVEPLPVPIRFSMPASRAYRFMMGIKEPDKVFLTRNGYLPNYGDVVVTKNLGGAVVRHNALNSIPEEFTTRRALSLRNNANIYIPDEKLQEVSSQFRGYKFRPKSELQLQPYGLADRVRALLSKVKSRFVKESSEADSNSKFKRLFGRNAQLVGSEALGINVPGSSDTDVFVPYKRKLYFNRALERMGVKYPDLKMNRASLNREDKKTFTGSVNGQPMDVVMAYGPRAEKFRSAFDMAMRGLDARKRREIVARKAELKKSWFFPETRYKWYKKQLADELGLRDAYF